jgi:hypothetical protein
VANPLVGKSTTAWSIVGIVTFIVGILQLPQASAFISTVIAAHPNIATILTGVMTVLALFFKPQTTTPPPSSPTSQKYQDYQP